RDPIARLAAHPLARAMRPDKITLAALSATLLSYLRGRAIQEIPVWQMIAQPAEDIEIRARRFQVRASAAGLAVELVRGESTVGGGSLPGETLPTHLLNLPRALSPQSLKAHSPPVIGRIRQGRVQLDLRTVLEADDDMLLECVLRSSRLIDDHE
ncbi:MAG: L-seryl-tRNA(Sec) selenium transferase, partial [Chloroflexota bacterium]|nr:L-seryl-tRNA(Sec) selenium transferase [Chloroflexota bacterium]